ncbi:Arc family DNA-binding protein [Acuticoccus sp. M5D2P5]|uniref:Arc family DNA-binding protein n=1 Tax=Acuticoccus kalidii TaxID=2910977 RepID=UPI001F2855BA|nr:Arc family DNA-binding protein [Acuticoccus kalidii]MCF3934310.1 Arc family DNA-binding protein [Acuticoccus kalidii]
MSPPSAAIPTEERITIRAPRGLRSQLKIRAIHNGRSLNDEVLDLIGAGLRTNEKAADERQLADR